MLCSVGEASSKSECVSFTQRLYSFLLTYWKLYMKLRESPLLSLFGEECANMLGPIET